MNEKILNITYYCNHYKLCTTCILTCRSRLETYKRLVSVSCRSQALTSRTHSRYSLPYLSLDLSIPEFLTNPGQKLHDMSLNVDVPEHEILSPRQENLDKP